MLLDHDEPMNYGFARNLSYCFLRFGATMLMSIELDEVVEPLLQPESSVAHKDVSVAPTSVEEKANNDDHGASDQVTIEPRRSTRVCTTSEW